MRRSARAVQAPSTGTLCSCASLRTEMGIPRWGNAAPPHRHAGPGPARAQRRWRRMHIGQLAQPPMSVTPGPSGWRSPVEATATSLASVHAIVEHRRVACTDRGMSTGVSDGAPNKRQAANIVNGGPHALNAHTARCGAGGALRLVERQTCTGQKFD
ncbi:hypothetical protein B0H13DRAFT_1918650 [Mycena leptocephala]|nr:hypothetical protein B0H13DRAFT_1918650 [Mycena leptocephala]